MAKKKEDVPAPETAAAEVPSEPTFLKDIAEMATVVEEVIRKLRTEAHRDKFEFKDLSYLFPQKVDSVEYLTRLESVVKDYLERTAPAGLESRGDWRQKDALEANTATYAGTTAAWMKAVYTARKEEIDKRVKALSGRISGLANQEVRNTVFELGLSSGEQDRFFAVMERPKLNLEALLAGELAELKTQIYETELPRPEDLAKLYELCFNIEVRRRGWLDLEDEKLLEALAQENVPLELFQKYYPEREIKVPEREASLTGIPAVDNIIVMPDRDPAAGRDVGAAQSSSIFTARDYIEAPSYFQALQALRQSYAGRECPNQPKIMINGREYVRPPTFEELLYAKVNDFHSKSNADGSAKEGEDPLRFFKVWLDSCTGRHYKRGTNKFKLIPICPQLISLSAEPRLNYLDLPYADSEGEERDSSNGKYNTNLSRSEVLKHPDWLFLANENRQLLGEVFDIIKSAGGGDANWKGMTFYINLEPQNDELRPLYVYGHLCLGYADGWDILRNRGRFLRV